MDLASRIVCSIAVALVLLAPRGAAAMGAVVGPSAEPVSIASARVAVSASTGRTTRWAQITITRDDVGFAWLLPVAPGALVDLGSDAWLDALDAATVPVVEAPSSPNGCAITTTPEVSPAASSPSSRAPAQALVTFDAPSLTTFVSSVGLVIPDSLRAGIADAFASGEMILALTYAAGSLPTHTVRIVDGNPASLPFSLSDDVHADVAVSSFVIAGDAMQAGARSRSVDPSALVWFADGTSSYAASIASLLSEGRSGWATESAEPSAFFEATLIPGARSLPATLDGYFTLAAEYGDASAEPGACARAAASTREASSAYAAACPLGAIATVPGPSPCASSDPPGATPIQDLVCGAAVDAALAVANLSPRSLWITRFAGLITHGSAADVRLLDGAPPVPIAVVAGGYGNDCPPRDAGAADVPDGGGGETLGVALEPPPASTSDEEASGSEDATSADGCGASATSDEDDGDGGGGGCSGDSGGDSGGCSGDDSPTFDDCSTARHKRRARSPLSRVVVAVALALGLARRMRRPAILRRPTP